MICVYDFEKMDPRFVAFVNIFICANRLQAIMDSGFEDITAKQWLAVMMIDAFEEPPTLKQISDMSGVTHQSMRQIVDRLIDKGFLEVVPDKKDKRAIRLVKTEAAGHFRTKKAGQDESFVYRMFECLTEEETSVYCKALAKLCDRLAELKKENDA